MMPFICCPSWMNGVLGQRGKDFHGCEHLPVLQRHTKLLANAGVWQNVCVCVLTEVSSGQAGLCPQSVVLIRDLRLLSLSPALFVFLYSVCLFI